MATMLFDRVVKSGDTVRFPFSGNASGETWATKVFQVATDGGSDIEITTGVTVGSAVGSTALYHLSVAPGALTAGKMYYAFATRASDGAVVRMQSWAYAPTNDIGQLGDGSNVDSVFGRLSKLDLLLGTAGFAGGSTNLYAMLTGADGLNTIRLATDSIKTSLAGDITAVFDAVGGVAGSPTGLAQALRKIYDAVVTASSPWDDVISGSSVAGQAGTYLKNVADSVGAGTDAAAADYTSGSVQAKLRKLGAYVDLRLPASGYANSTTSVAAGQGEIYSKLGLVQDKTDLIGATADGSGVNSLFGRFASVGEKLGSSADTSSTLTTVFGRVAAVQASVDRLNKITNAQLLPIVPTEVASPATSVAAGIAIKFELKVTDPSTGALDDPDTFAAGAEYKAHVRVTDLNNAHWGSRLYQDGALTTTLVISSGGADEPLYSVTPLGGGAASEAFRRLKRESQGQFAGFVKILPTDNTTLNFLFQIVDSDAASTPASANTFMSWSTMVVRQPAAIFPSPGAF